MGLELGLGLCRDSLGGAFEGCRGGLLLEVGVGGGLCCGRLGFIQSQSERVEVLLLQFLCTWGKAQGRLGNANVQDDQATLKV